MTGEIINKGELDDAIKDYSQRGDLGNQTDRWIDMTRFRFGQQLRAQSNEVAVLGLTPTVPDGPLYDIPTNFVEMRSVFLLDANGLRERQLLPLSLNAMVRHDISEREATGYVFTGAGTGAVNTTVSQQLQVIGGTGEAIDIVYWSIPDFLNADSDTNETLLQWPYLYLYACLIEAHTFTLDFEARDSMKEIYDKELMAANQSSQKALSAAGAAVLPPGRCSFGSAPVRGM